MFGSLYAKVSDKTKIAIQKSQINAMSTQRKVVIGTAFAASIALNVVLLKTVTEQSKNGLNESDCNYLNKLIERDRIALM